MDTEEKMIHLFECRSCCHGAFPGYLKLCLFTGHSSEKGELMPGEKKVGRACTHMSTSLLKRWSHPSFPIWNVLWPFLRVLIPAMWHHVSSRASSVCPSSSAAASLPSCPHCCPHDLASAPSPGRAQCPGIGCPWLGWWDGACSQALPCCTQQPAPHCTLNSIQTQDKWHSPAPLRGCFMRKHHYLEPVASNFCLRIETWSLV